MGQASIWPGQVSPLEATPSRTRHGHTRPGQVGPRQARSSRPRSGKLGSGRIRPGLARSGRVRSSHARPSRARCSHCNPSSACNNHIPLPRLQVVLILRLVFMRLLPCLLPRLLRLRRLRLLLLLPLLLLLLPACLPAPRRSYIVPSCGAGPEGGPPLCPDHGLWRACALTLSISDSRAMAVIRPTRLMCHVRLRACFVSSHTLSVA